MREYTNGVRSCAKIHIRTGLLGRRWGENPIFYVIFNINIQ